VRLQKAVVAIPPSSNKPALRSHKNQQKPKTMGGCCSAPDPSARSERAPKRFEQPTDVIFFLLFIISCGFTCWLAYTTWTLSVGTITYGHDSYGNICSLNNADAVYYQSTAEDPKDHVIGYVANYTAVGNMYHMDHTNNAKAYDSRFGDIEVIAEQKNPLDGDGKTYCTEKCPGQDLPASINKESVLQMLAAQIYLANKNALITEASHFATMVESLGGGVTSADATATAEALWCETFFTNAGYQASNPDVEAFCLANKVILPSDLVSNRCVPNQILVGILVRAAADYAESQNQQNGVAPEPAETPEEASVGEDKGWFEEKLSAIGAAITTLQKEMIGSCVIALVIAVLVILIIQLLTKYIVKILVIAFFLCSCFGIVYVWVGWYIKEKKMQSEFDPVRFQGFTVCQGVHNATVNATAESRFYEGICDEGVPDDEEWKNYRIWAIVITVVCLAMCITICCCWSNIALAVELFDEAGQCVFSMLGILAQPAITIALVIVTYLVCALQIYYALQIKQRVMNQEDDEDLTVRFESKSQIWEYAWLYLLFNGFWVAVFIDGVHQTSLAGAVSAWFFSETKTRTVVCCPAWNAVKMTLKYNLGSIALGSLLIAIMRTIQVIIWIIERQAQIQTPPGVEPGKFRQALFSCLKACSAFVERWLAFLNRNAYIGIAVFGYDFCRAAQKALSLKVENAGRAATTAIICKGVLFLGTLISIAGSVACFNLVGNYFNDKMGAISKDMYAFVTVHAIVGLFSWLITSVFLSVYEMTLDTIFICFCEDQQRNNGKDRPYFSSPRLVKFMRENA